MQNNSIVKGHILAFGTILFWGTTFVSTKILLNDFTPVEVLFFRFVLGYFTLWLLFPRLLHTAGWRQERIFMGAGLSGITLYFLLENVALNYTFASNVGVIVGIAPFCTALLAQIFLKDGSEPLTLPFFLGFLVAITGIGLIAFNGSAVLQLNPLGDALAALGAVAWAFYSICMRKIGEMGHHTGLCTRRVFFWGLLFMLPAVYMTDVSLNLEKLARPVNWGNLCFLGLGASALCFMTWNWAVKALGAIKASAYIYLVPVVTVVSAALILNERITGLAIIGTALTLVGLVISELKGGRKAKKGEGTAGKS